MGEYWENKFIEIETMWGYEPADSAIQTCDFFVANHIQNILIPGIGYGRNANIFLDKGIRVTGIEISKSAIQLAKEKNNIDILIHHGSVTRMPFDNQLFDGIYCYALIHLLNQRERKQFIQNCFNQLQTNGYMIFVAVSKKADIYGKGRLLSKDRFELMKGVRVYFYDLDSAAREFQHYGMIEAVEFEEPIKFMNNQPPLNCILIKCQKK